MSDHHDPIPEGDAELAALMKRFGAADSLDQEEIILTDWLAAAFNRDILKSRERIVTLACGHEVLTKNQHRMVCPKCRYLVANGYDYDGFRRLGLPDPLHGYWDRIEL